MLRMAVYNRCNAYHVSYFNLAYKHETESPSGGNSGILAFAVHFLKPLEHHRRGRTHTSIISLFNIVHNELTAEIFQRGDIDKNTSAREKNKAGRSKLLGVCALRGLRCQLLTCVQLMPEIQNTKSNTLESSLKSRTSYSVI